MPRAIWSGAISFGLVDIRVKLFSAISEKSVRFHQIDRRNGARVRQRRVNAETGEEVPYEEIVKGYEISPEQYVMVTDEELTEFAPTITRSIEIECFVHLDEIDPIFFDGAYHVVPDKSARPYALLVRAMEDQGKVGIAKFVLRSKQYLAALRPRDGSLLLSMMVYADEVVDRGSIEGLVAAESVEINERELAMATQLIDSLTEPFDPESYHDTYREQVLDLLESKADGREITVSMAGGPSSDRVVDLMAALEASVAAARDTRSRHPTARESA